MATKLNVHLRICSTGNENLITTYTKRNQTFCNIVQCSFGTNVEGYSAWGSFFKGYDSRNSVVNISAVINKTSFEDRGMLYKEYQPFGPTQMCKDTSARGYILH